MSNWERCYSRNGCPYYLNHNTLQSQWEHPYFARILTEANDYNDVIYAAYRTALKMLHIRNKLELEKLDVEKIECALGDIIPLHDIKLNEYLTLAQLDEAVHRLYGYCCPSLSKMVWTGAMSSCFLYFFDGKRRGTVNTLSLLILLTVLSSDILINKYSFLFQCLSQHNLVGAQDISHLKKTVFTVLAKLKEDRAYKNAYEGNGTTMTNDMFVKWLLSEPKFLVWLCTLHRIHAAISVVHSTKCYLCKNSRIVGLRYRCLQCFNVDMCFQCFTRIPAYGKHDKSHSVEEYCMPSKRIQDVNAFLAKVRNNIKKKSKKFKNGERQFDLTARRQPATVWHDPRLVSPAGEHKKDHPPTDTEEDNETTLTKQPKTFERNHQYPDKYSHSLPRRSKRISNTQSSEYANPSHESDYLYDHPTQRDIRLSSHSSAWIKHNRNQEPYPPSTKVLKNPSNTSELQFYGSTRKAVPYRCESTYPNTPVNTTRSATRSYYSNGYSEDEGIVVNSESDSSVSQFATHDNRDTYTVPGQPSLPSYDSYKRYTRHEPVVARTFDYNRHATKGCKSRQEAIIYANLPTVKKQSILGEDYDAGIETTERRTLQCHSPVVIRAYQV